MQEKYDKYECNVRFRISENSAYVFDNLEEKELRLSNSIKVINVRRESKKVITGRMVTNSQSQNNMHGDNSIRNINEYFNLFGIRVEKEPGVFFREDREIGREVIFGTSAVENISQFEEAIDLRKLVTPKFIKHENISEKFLFVLNRLKNAADVYTPLDVNQLLDFLFENSNDLGSFFESDLRYRVPPDKLMEMGNELFEKEAGFCIGEVLKSRIDEKTKRFKYYGKDKEKPAPQENKRAFASIVKLDMDVDKAKIFILMRAMRNMSAHFEGMKDDDKVSGFIRFIYNHAEDYKNPIMQLAYEWLGIKKDFKRLTGNIISAGD